MLRYERSAPIWLFSFVDLAFLLLIAFTQIGTDPGADPGDLAELEIPRIHGRGTPVDGRSTAAAWQLRVHPTTATDGQDHTPFELVEPGRLPTDSAHIIDADELAAHLRLMNERSSAKPVLAPHRDARAEDLLIAVSLLEDVWRNDRTVTVRPGPPVASGSRGDAH